MTHDHAASVVDNSEFDALSGAERSLLAALRHARQLRREALYAADAARDAREAYETAESAAERAKSAADDAWKQHTNPDSEVLE